MLFRTQDNVPEIYVQESRDFQLLGRMKDMIFGGVKYTIDSLNHTSNTMEMNATLLPLLKSKVGFFEYEELTEDQLRYLLTGFPDLIKYKGSKKAIEKAVCLWFRINRIQARLLGTFIDNTAYKVTIVIDASTTDTQILTEIFKYILPAGYQVEYQFASDSKYTTNYKFTTNSLVADVAVKDMLNFQESKEEYDDQDISNMVSRLSSSVGLTYLATKKEITNDTQEENSNVDIS